ncbi:MAG: DUF3800 domain-containing protein [Spirochaetota bacterium]
MYTKPQNAFIDERGNYGFDFTKNNVSKYFLINAIIIDADNVNSLSTDIEQVRKKYFQTGEMKSSKVASDDKRRFKILASLSKYDFHVFTLVVDKRKLYKDSGLMYKKVFYKYLNKLAYTELFKSFNNLTIIADEYGRKEFMASFQKYMQAKHPPELFSESYYTFIESKSDVLIQLSDFICGTLALNYEEERGFDYISKVFKLLGDKIIRIAEWPEIYKDYIFDSDNKPQYSELDKLISGRSIFLVNEFIHRNNNSDDYDIKNQCNFLKYLLLHERFIGSDEYISTKEILSNLNSFPNMKINEHYLRSKIVAKVRDEGVIISSGNKGYKIPTSEGDIYSYLNHCNTIIAPMLSRIKKCRDYFLLSSKNQYDILSKKEYENIKSILENIMLS